MVCELDNLGSNEQVDQLVKRSKIKETNEREIKWKEQKQESDWGPWFSEKMVP